MKTEQQHPHCPSQDSVSGGLISSGTLIPFDSPANTYLCPQLGFIGGCGHLLLSMNIYFPSKYSQMLQGALAVSPGKDYVKNQLFRIITVIYWIYDQW